MPGSSADLEYRYRVISIARPLDPSQPPWTSPGVSRRAIGPRFAAARVEEQHCHRLLLLVALSGRELDVEADSCYSRKDGSSPPGFAATGAERPFAGRYAFR
jgi:hypothetical protein